MRARRAWRSTVPLHLCGSRPLPVGNASRSVFQIDSSDRASDIQEEPGRLSSPGRTRLRNNGDQHATQGKVMRVLLIEDHKPLVRGLRKGLEEEGFAVDVAYDGEEGDFKAKTAEYDVIILDVMLPKMDGLALLQKWRREGLQTHVLMLT